MPPRPGRFALLLSASDRPLSGLAHPHRETMVPASRHETFAFFGDASNLERLTPGLNFAILTPTPVRMWAGVDIDDRISLNGLPMPWPRVILSLKRLPLQAH